MTPRYIDLHTHSLASDGSDAPGEVVRQAASLKLAALALTDHDTLKGLDEAGREAKRLGISFIRGIEIAVDDEYGEVHLLGLWMPEPSASMSEALSALQETRRARNRLILDRLNDMGMPLTMEEVRALSSGSAVGRPHIAEALKNRGYVSSRQEAFSNYLGWSGTAFVSRTLLSPREGIGLLNGEGATVILAHPCLSRLMTEERLDDLLSDFRALGLRGVEAYHSAHEPRQVRLCVELAAKHNLLLSGGSDYHGTRKEGVFLGRGKSGLRVPLHVLEKMREYRKSKGLWV